VEAAGSNPAIPTKSIIKRFKPIDYAFFGLIRFPFKEGLGSSPLLLLAVIQLVNKLNSELTLKKIKAPQGLEARFASN
jgi:hypothetical protein